MCSAPAVAVVETDLVLLAALTVFGIEVARRERGVYGPIRGVASLRGKAALYAKAK